jgi:hypothetical protein
MNSRLSSAATEERCLRAFWREGSTYARNPSSSGLTREQIIKQTDQGIGGADMDGLPAEDIKVEIN